MARALIAVLAMAVFGGCSGIRGFPGQDSFDRGLILFNEGRFEAAIPHFQNAARENPDFAQAYFYLGRSYVSVSRWRSAIAPLRTAFRLAPSESREEISNLLLDALFAVAVNDWPMDKRLSGPPPAPLKEAL